MKILFRKHLDVIIEDDSNSAPKIFKKFEDYCEQHNLGDPSSFELMGSAEPTDIPKDIIEEFEKDYGGSNEGFAIVSMQYRGENFAVICEKNTIGDSEAFFPLMMILTEHQKTLLRDIKGNAPTRINQRENKDA